MKFLVAALALVAVFVVSLGQHIHVTPRMGGLSGTGTTTRYWDCCKPSCGWVENVNNLTSVATCSKDGSTVVLPSVKSSCLGGGAFMCSNQQAQVINDTFAIGFAAASFTGGADTHSCCSCFLLKFQGALAPKQLVVQVTNTGGDLGSNQFDLAIPGGGVGIFTEGCSAQWGTPGNGWGDQYGGVGSDSACNQLPASLQDGCHFRFTYMNGVSNPQVTFEEVSCPSQLTSISGCSI